MEIIKNLVADKYDLFNVDIEKCPVTKNGHKMSDWINKTHEELKNHHNYKSHLWGFKLGQQTNGKHILSLDFDIYDKKIKENQKETADKLKEYLEGCLNQNGMYYSSTEGNHNVLIDYTNSPTLIKWVEEVQTAKFTYYGLEILLKGNQVIPPSQTNCKKSGDLGKPRTFITNNPFYILNENENCFTFRFVKSPSATKNRTAKINNNPITIHKTETNFTVTKKEEETDEEDAISSISEIENPKKKIKIIKNAKMTDIVMDDKFIDLLFYVIGNNANIGWNEWFLIAGALKTNGYDCELFELYSKQSTTFQFTEDQRNVTKKLWNSINSNKKISIYALQNLAKENNPEEYQKWLKKYNIYSATYDEINNPFNCAKLIQKTLKQNLIYCKKEWYMITSNQLWKNQKEPTYYILDEIHKYLDFQRNIYNEMLNKTHSKEIAKSLENWVGLYMDITKPGYLSVLVKCLQPLLTDDTFSNILNTNKGQLVFKNGIMNLETKKFRNEIFWYDFVSETIPYDYVESDYVELKKILKPILNNDDNHLEYFLSILGYTFIGEADLQKAIYFMIDKTDCGKGDNGKTFFFGILNALMPNYVYRSKSTLLELNNSKVHKQIIMTKGKRLVWLEELPKEKYMNPQLMKEIADGNTLENEIMFGTSEEINIMFKLFALSNHIPKIDPNESAVYNRYKQVSFNSHFDRTGTRKEPNPQELKFIADPGLPDRIKTTMYNEVFNLIIDYAHKYYKNEKKLPTIPQQFLNDTKETQNKNDEFGLWFEENCEIKADSRIAIDILISKSGMSKKIIIEGMNRKGIKYNCELKGLGSNSFNKPYRGGFTGITIIEREDEIESEVEC